MTTTNQTGSSFAGGSTDGSADGAKERAAQTAGTAAEQGQHVAGVAKDEAQNVASEAKNQAHGLLEEARTQVDEQTRTGRDRLVGTLRSFSDDLDQMAGGGQGSGMAGDLARQLADRTRRLGDHLDGREPTQVLDDVRDFARRRPGTFLLGALAAGVAAGRLTRGARDAQSTGTSAASTASTSSTGTSGTTAGSPYDEPRGTATGSPVAGTGRPTGVPAPATASDPLDPSLGAETHPNTTQGGVPGGDRL